MSGEPTEAEWVAGHLKAVISDEHGQGLTTTRFRNGTALTRSQVENIIKLLLAPSDPVEGEPVYQCRGKGGGLVWHDTTLERWQAREQDERYVYRVLYTRPSEPEGARAAQRKTIGKLLNTNERVIQENHDLRAALASQAPAQSEEKPK